jgi:hypothetical protein
VTRPGPADDQPTEAVPAARTRAAARAEDAAGTGNGETPSGRRTRLILIAAVAAIGAAGLLLAFLVGTRLAPAAPPPVATRTASASPTPVATATPTPAAEPIPTGAVAPGTYEWNRLGGGECLDPYISPWEREFTVVDCAAPHPAQLLARGAFDGDATAPYPGEQALTAQLNLRCTAAAVLDLGAASAYADLQFQAAYPAGAEQWTAGDRAYFCFVSRSSGQPLTGSVAVG